MSNPLFRQFWKALRNLQTAEDERQARRQAVNTALDSLGQAGRIIRKAIRRSRDANRIIDDIFEGMRASGEGKRLRREPATKTPPEHRGSPTPDPLWKQRQQQQETPQREQQRQDNRVTVQTSHGQRSYHRNHPIVTGQMIPVVSSNVHSIGFRIDWDAPDDSRLLIRYKDSRKGRGGKAGALYAYYGVHPDEFQQLQQATSKGEWVWDELRIRGTVSGHQKPYMLKGISGDGYVPRQAVRIDDEEYYVGRTVEGTSNRTGRRRVYQSELKNQRVQRVSRGVPDRGTPNRGRSSNRRG